MPLDLVVLLPVVDQEVLDLIGDGKDEDYSPIEHGTFRNGGLSFGAYRVFAFKDGPRPVNAVGQGVEVGGIGLDRLLVFHKCFLNIIRYY